jgi:hypothetical protein
MHDGGGVGGHDGGHHRADGQDVPPPGRRVDANYRYIGTVLFLGALAMIMLMVLVHR